MVMINPFIFGTILLNLRKFPESNWFLTLDDYFLFNSAIVLIDLYKRKG